MSLEAIPLSRAVRWFLIPFALLLVHCGGSTGADDDNRQTTSPTPVVDATAAPGDDDSSQAGDDDTTDQTTATPGDPGDDDSAYPPYPGEVKTGFYITGSFPQDGAMLVPQQVQVKVYFSEPYECDLSKITATITGSHTQTTVTLANPVLGEDLLSVGWPVDLWSSDWNYTLEVTADDSECPFLDAAWPVTYTASFRTDVVCGQSFDIFNELQIVQLGEDEAAAEQMTAVLTSSGQTYPTALMLEGITQNVSFPIISVDAAVGSVTEQEDGTYAFGYGTGVSSTIEDCTVDEDGGFYCATDRATFPIQLYSTTTLYLYLELAEIYAQLEASGDITEMNDFVLTGVILGNDLYQLLASAGYTEFFDLVVMDVDTDGDGFADAANVEIDSDPVLITVTQCEGT